MDNNAKRKRSELSDDETSTGAYSRYTVPDLDDTSSEEEDYKSRYVKLTTLNQVSVAALPPNMTHHSRQDTDLLLSSYALNMQNMHHNHSSSNMSNTTELITNMPHLILNGNNYAHTRRKWTYEMDERLREGYNLYGKQWAKVAEHVGCNLHREQCRKRWSMAANIELQFRRKGEWTDEELIRLRILADSLENRKGVAGTNRKKDLINWTQISKELNRDYKECADKYKSMLAASMMKGPYSREEDMYILRRVNDWGNKGQGLWIALQSEMNRRSDSINKRYQRIARNPDLMVYGDPKVDDLMF